MGKRVFKKCLIEVELPFEDDKLYWDLADDILNDVGNYFEESDIKQIGEITQEIDE